MDVFKLAFETTVVGLLTLGWLFVATCLLFPGFRIACLLQKLPSFLEKNVTALGVGTLVAAYCLGSAVLPISNQLVNDEHWPLNESAIRCQVFTREELNLEAIHQSALPALPAEQAFTMEELRPRHCSYWAPIFTNEKINATERVRRFFRRWIGLPTNAGEAVAEKDPAKLAVACKNSKSTACDEFKAERILTIFLQQETVALSGTSDATDRLRVLHERIVVLRGTIFSLFVLFLMCLFAYFARVNGTVSSWIRPACGVVLALAFTAFGLFNGYYDLTSRDIFDIPVLESLLVVITIFGITLAVRKAKNEQFHSKRYVLVTLFFTGLAYGGWMWSEIIYDQEVINGFVVAQQHVTSSKE